MSEIDVLPELKQILGAMVFGANRPLPAKKMRDCLVDVAKTVGGDAAAFAEVKPADVERALKELQDDLLKAKVGFHLTEVAGGFRLQSDVACGKWLKSLLEMGAPSRLSRPALETLSIIAYRQPISRADIEGIRGVAVDHVIRALMEMHLIKIVGRSELPGRPFLYGTTQTFLEHFGLKSIKELGEVDPMLMRRAEAARVAKANAAAGNAAAPEPARKPDTARTEMADLLEGESESGGEPVFEAGDPAAAPEPAATADEEDVFDEDEDEFDDDEFDDEDDDDEAPEQDAEDEGDDDRG